MTVLVKGTSLGSATDTEGKFKLSLPSQENVVLVFSFVGMQTKEVPYKGESEIKVTLQTDVTEMEQVVVTGIFTRKTESYTCLLYTSPHSSSRSGGYRKRQPDTPIR